MIRIFTRTFAFRSFQKTHYSVLGVPNSASQAEIKAAYFRLAKKLHPDQPAGSETRFKEVNEAYKVLGNEDSRAQYDASLLQSENHSKGNNNEEGNSQWTHWSRTYYYSYDPFVGRRTFYREDFRPNSSRRKSSESRFFADWEDFVRKFSQSSSEESRATPAFSPYFKTGLGLFVFLWVWSILEKAGHRSEQLRSPFRSNLDA